MDLNSVIGTCLGVGSILLGQFLGGGEAGQLVQGISVVIVIGGTIGAILISYSSENLAGAFSLISEIFFISKVEYKTLGNELVHLASVARKDGFLALESELENLKNSNMKQCTQWVIDGHSSEIVEEIIEQKKISNQKKWNLSIQVFELAGNIAPTIFLIAGVGSLIFDKIEILKKRKITPDPRNWTYEKPNFKLIRWWILRKFSRILKRIPKVLEGGPQVHILTTILFGSGRLK